MKKIILLVLLTLFALQFNAQNNKNYPTPFSAHQSLTNYDTLIDSRDGEVYLIVRIGNQDWMAENLRYNKKRSWLNAENLTKKYGRLYDWKSIMNKDEKDKNICPKGWHVPSDKEWRLLELNLGMSLKESKKLNMWRGTNQGDQMKSKLDWPQNGHKKNESGFNVLPAGHCTLSGVFLGFGKDAAFWSSTQTSCKRAIARYIEKEKATINRYKAKKKYGASCRCIKNQ